MNFGFSILDFRLETKDMTKKSRTAFLCFRSDNRKPVVSNVEPSAIQNPKWVGLSVIVFMLVAGGVVAQAQQPKKVPQIGLLISPAATEMAPFIDAFRQGLRELGYIEGKNIVLDIREGGTEPARIADLAAELVRLKVDIIVAEAGPAVIAAKKATRTIPIVMRVGVDPVRMGVVDSLAYPGGNITGLASITVGLIGKRFELLAETVPGAQRIAVLTALSDRARFVATDEYKEIDAAARAIGVKLQDLLARDPDAIDNAFVAVAKERAQGLVVIPSPRYFQHRERIIKHATNNRLPTMHFQRIFVENGGLMSYAADYIDEYRRLAIYVDKILKGTKPANLPVEQPKKFEFVINLKAAKQIGLTIPPNVLARADWVIR
jgi:putative ABC transport system substrate-binding protein